MAVGMNECTPERTCICNPSKGLIARPSQKTKEKIELWIYLESVSAWLEV